MGEAQRASSIGQGAEESPDTSGLRSVALEERGVWPKAKGIGQRFTLGTVEKTNRLFARVTIDPMAGRFTK